MKKYLQALKDKKTLEIEYESISVAGDERTYITQITNETEEEILNYFNSKEVYSIKSLSVLSQDYVFSLSEVEKELNGIKSNSLEFHINII